MVDDDEVHEDDGSGDDEYGSGSGGLGLLYDEYDYFSGEGSGDFYLEYQDENR